MESPSRLAAGAARQTLGDRGLAHGFVSPATAMVAIGEETVIEGGVKHTSPVPVSVPAGMQWQLVKKQTTVTTVAPVSDGVADDERAGGEANEPTTRAAPDAGVTLASESIALRSRARPLRLALALGGGLAWSGGDTAPLVSLGGRLDYGRRLVALGLEGSLWLLSLDDGLHPQGRVLATASVALPRPQLELGAGIGVHGTGDAAGPAFDLTLRYALPVRGVAGVLRYDGSLLDGSGLHAISVGVETRW